MAACGFLFQRSHPLISARCLHHFHLQAQGHTEPGCAMLTLQLHACQKGASILPRITTIQGTEDLHDTRRKPSLRNVMDSRSRGSFEPKLTLNSIEQPLKFPRVALRSSERQTEKAYCLHSGAITVLGWRNAFPCDIPYDCS